MLFIPQKSLEDDEKNIRDLITAFFTAGIGCQGPAFFAMGNFLIKKMSILCYSSIGEPASEVMSVEAGLLCSLFCFGEMARAQRAHTTGVIIKRPSPKKSCIQ